MLGSRSPFTRPLSRESVQRDLAGFERALAQSEAADGADGPATSAARTALARAYRILGRPAEAQALCERNLAACERLLGADDPATLIARSDLARCHRASRDQDLARKVVTDIERVLGPDHHATLLARLDLQAVLIAGHDPASAELAAALLAEVERVLGPEHEDAMYARWQLALAELHAGHGGQAIMHAAKNLAISDRVLGSDDLATEACRANLGWCYVRTGRSAEGLPLLTGAHTALSGVLGADSIFATSASAQLAVGYVNTGQPGAAIPLVAATLARNERELGSMDRTTIAARRMLARIYLAAGQNAEAIPLLEQALADLTSTRGAGHPDTLEARLTLAAALAKVGRISESVDLYQHVIAERTRTLGADDPATVAAKSALASVRRGWLANTRSSSMLLGPAGTGRSAQAPMARRIAAAAASVLLLAGVIADIRLADLHVTRPCRSALVSSVSASGQFNLTCTHYGTVSSAVPVLRLAITGAAIAVIALLASLWLSNARSARNNWAEYAGVPAETGKRLGRATISDRYRAERIARYGPGYGDTAAKFDSDRTRAILASHAFQLAQPVLILLFALLYRDNAAPFIELYIPVELLLGGLSFGTGKTLQASRQQLASRRREELGIDAAAARSAPTGPADYVRWCEARGLPPYPHGRPQHAPQDDAEGLASAASPG
jgi:tetratricopeptide (TPR) repeat protein